MSITHEDTSQLLESLQCGLSENLQDIDRAVSLFTQTLPLLCKNILQMFTMYQLLDD
jgi:hypothetical protein